MSTLLWILVGVGAWVLLFGLVLSLLTAGRRSDEAMAEALLRERPAWARAPRRHHPPPRPGVEASSHWLAQRTADVQSALAVERIAVLLRDPDDERAWVVEACGGVPHVCGMQLAPGAAADLLGGGGAEWPRWNVATAPILVEGEHVGEIAVATHRELRPRDEDFLARFAGLLAGRVGSPHV